MDATFAPPPAIAAPDARSGPDPNALRQPLPSLWYCVGRADTLRPGQLRAVDLLDDKLVVGRDASGALFALRDRCPHRGMALSKGRFADGEITCPFHGWRFRTNGTCAAIPALSAEDRQNVGQIAVPRFPVGEGAGMIWVRTGAAEHEVPPVPQLDFAPRGRIVVELIVEASYDMTVLSLVDPAHVAFVHDSWWYRTSKQLREKVKQFEPSPFGFTMTSHRAKNASAIYRLLGGVPDVEIEFRLPGVRLERISIGEKRLANYTFATPLDRRRTALTNVLAWNMPGLTLLKPLGIPLARQFLTQDKDVLELAQAGMDRKPAMVLLGQADLPSQWYFNLKREFLRAEREGTPFLNPLQPQELRWKS